jgi:hypothetical protein
MLTSNATALTAATHWRACSGVCGARHTPSCQSAAAGPPRRVIAAGMRRQAPRLRTAMRKAKVLSTDARRSNIRGLLKLKDRVRNKHKEVM